MWFIWTLAPKATRVKHFVTPYLMNISTEIAWTGKIQISRVTSPVAEHFHLSEHDFNTYFSFCCIKQVNWTHETGELVRASRSGVPHGINKDLCSTKRSIVNERIGDSLNPKHNPSRLYLVRCVYRIKVIWNLGIVLARVSVLLKVKLGFRFSDLNRYPHALAIGMF